MSLSEVPAELTVFRVKVVGLYAGPMPGSLAVAFV
jgi:hypothetical protein